uniref:Uncharacterized protein n=1 Tax=Tetranychus urticae TaxID=32264 RepID=T1JRY9_TETUR
MKRFMISGGDDDVNLAMSNGALGAGGGGDGGDNDGGLFCCIIGCCVNVCSSDCGLDCGWYCDDDTEGTFTGGNILKSQPTHLCSNRFNGLDGFAICFSNIATFFDSFILFQESCRHTLLNIIRNFLTDGIHLIYIWNKDDYYELRHQN